MSAPAVTENDSQLLQVGMQCSHPQCLLVDFLPFKCQHCAQSFCQEHYRVKDGHECSKYDEFKFNRVAPDCPLCNVPVSVKPGQDPNDRMEQHFQTECSVVTGRVKAKTTPLCGKATCKKVLFAPIVCPDCRGQYCPSHRFRTDHSCKASERPTPAVRQNAAAAAQAKANAIQSSASTTAKKLNAQASAKANEAAANLKQSLASANAAAASASKSMPFNKTDRRSASPTAFPDTTLTTDVPTTNAAPNQPANEPTIRPPPVINPLSSFIPRPIFASA